MNDEHKRRCELDDPPGCDKVAVNIAEWDPALLVGFLSEGMKEVRSPRAYCAEHTPDVADRWRVRPITDADQP
jgi:hypothetical protein